MRRELGFTLLELLIGMVLLSFILGLLFSGFRLATTSWDAVETRIDRTNDEALARALVRRLLTHLQPVRWKKAMNQPVAFSGDRAVLRALAPVTGQSGAGGVRVIELTQEADPDAPPNGAARRLVLRHAPIRYDAEQFAEGLAGSKPHVVLGGIDAIEFSYFGPAARGAAPSWQDAWSNPEQLPLLIRLRMASRDKGWSEVLVAPMVGGTGCLWDNFHKRCR